MRESKHLITAMTMALTVMLSACTPDEITREAPPVASAISLVDGKYTLSSEIPSFSDFILVETQMGTVTPRVVDLKTAVNDLAQYDVVFVGEAHGHATSHYVQSKIFSGLYGKHNNIALSMEQFERSAQPIMDQYLAGEIGEETLVHDGKAWDHYRSSYRPMVEFARNKGLAVIAAEVPGNMVSCVGEEGPAFLDRLSGEPRSWIAKELHTEDGAYKDRYLSFLAMTAGHRVEGADMTEEEKAEKRFRRFAAQVSRDDTMAESIYMHMQANPGRKVMHINGSFHSAGLLGTVERLKAHNPELKLANIHPILVDDPENPSFDADLVGEGQYLLLIYPTPKRFVKMSNINAFIKRTKKKIDENRCGY
ncbi:MAG: ChaN family lipoprotein [Emcibacter sp.]|nr:ChaN family lipoprotein [Emcibacter sp.]